MKSNLIAKYTKLLKELKAKKDNYNLATCDIGDYSETCLACRIYKEILGDLKNENKINNLA